jgi:hypothetical protein
VYDSELDGGAVATIAPVGLAAEQIATMAPGSELAYLLEMVELVAADDFALVEVVAAWQRLAGWVAAGMVHAAAALAERPSMNPEWPASAGRVSEPNVAGEELAIRLGCSRRQARRLVRDGRAFEGALAWTGLALEQGEIDATKARILVDALVDQPLPLALDVQEAVLPGAPRRTPTQLAKDVARELIARDPGSAEERHQVGVDRRRVDRPKMLPDGMAGLWAVLPATGAARLDSALDGLARGARAVGDPRTLDQLRADLLMDLTTGEVEGSAAWVALAERHGDCDSDCDGGQGGAGADVGGADSAHGSVSPGTGAPRGAGFSPGPGDHGSRPGTFTPFAGTSRRTEIRVTVPLSTLLDLDDAPADLAGYGPITAEAARALARGGVWRRIVTDPLSGRALDVGRTRYRPPADLVTHVQVRDRTCARPGCSAPAESCDLDHTVEYHRDNGTTSADNLGPLCRRDHQVKTDAGFRLVQTEPGVFEWTTPAGHRYRMVPGEDAAHEKLPPVVGTFLHLPGVGHLPPVDLHLPMRPWRGDPPPF